MRYLLRGASPSPHGFQRRARASGLEAGRTRRSLRSLDRGHCDRRCGVLVSGRVTVPTQGTADLPGSTASGRLTPISTPLRAAWPSCPRDCASWVLEVTRAGPWAQGIDSSFKTLLWSGPLLPPPRVDPKQNGVFRPLGNHQAFSVAGSGLGPGAIGEKGPRREPCPAGAPSGPAKVTQVITHGGTPLHVEIQQQGTRHGSRGGAGPAEQGCLLWDKNVSQSGRVSGGKQLRGEGRGPACRGRSAEQERTRGAARSGVGDAGGGRSRDSGVTG